MTERADVLWRVEWPQPDGAGLAVLARWVAALLLAVGGARFIARRARSAPRSPLPFVGQQPSRPEPPGQMERQS
jgi:hypothetical protein